MLKKWKRFLLLALLFFAQAVQADQPIYILATHPRATGTAFEKVIRTHKEITVLHAPFLDPYLVRKYGLNHPFTLQLPNPAITFDDVKNKLFALAKDSPVFFKESGYILVDYLKTNPEFYKNPQVKIAILIRDPAKSILSFYRKMPTVDESIIGHRQLWDIFTMLQENGKTPLVIDSDAFLKTPLPILNKLGESWGLHFDEKNLKWESGFEEDWYLKDWYVEVAASTQLESYRGDVPRLEDGTPAYLEVADEKDRKRLQDFYRIQNVYYQKLMQYALKE